MKAIIVRLFTATLFVVCSAFPLDEKITKGQLDEKITKGQQANNYCATLTYNQGRNTGYVHLCYTPGKEGITHTCYLICMHARVYVAGLSESR